MGCAEGVEGFWRQGGARTRACGDTQFGSCVKAAKKKVPRSRLPHAAAPARPREGSPLQPAAEEEELLLGCI